MRPVVPGRYGRSAVPFMLFLLGAACLRAPPGRAQEQCQGYWSSLQLVRPSTAAVTGIATAADGRLFAGVAGGGLYIFAPDGSGNYSWSHIVSGRGGLLSDAVTDLGILRSTLWAGTTAGIGVMDLTEGSWRSYTTATSGLPSNTVNRLTPATGEMWVSTVNGAARWARFFFPGQGWVEVWTVLDASDGVADEFIRDVAVHTTSVLGNITETVWVSGLSHLYRWTGSGQATLVENTGDCRFQAATRMVVDRSNGLWFAGLRDVPAIVAGGAEGGGGAVLVPVGLCRYRAPTLISPSSWTHHSDGFAGLPVNDLSVDGAGRLWAALSGRAAVHDQGSYCFYTTSSYPLFNDQVTRVEAAGEGVWFGHSGAPGLTFHSPNWDRWTPARLGAPSGPAGAFLLEETATWVGIGAGVSVSTGGPFTYTAIPGNSSPVTALARDGGGTLWVGTGGSGVFFRFLNIYEPALGDGLPSPDVRALAVDLQGRLWAATAGGLALRANGYWLPFTAGGPGLGTNDLRALAVDSQDNLWIGTGDQGIAILDPDGHGANAWTSVDTSAGLPSNTVHGLAIGPGGAVWAATAAGAASFDGNGWTVHSAASGALPGDEALSVTADPAGRVWIGTAQGLALNEGGAWSHFHVTGSTLGSDRVRVLAATADRLYAAAGDSVATRDEITGPIGFFPPEIASFSPLQGPPGTEVTITGENFDPRGPSYNYVTIGESPAGGVGFPPRAQVLSATATQVVVRVPENATTGRIRVTAHELTATSGSDFRVTVAITSVEPTCLGVGDELTINGGGFYGAGGGGFAEVRIGSGSWRTADRQTPTQVKTRIRVSDTSGQVRVRLANGSQAVAPEMVTLGSIQLTGTRIQQAVEGLPLVWGKRTLVHLDFRAVDCTAHITTGTLHWKKMGGDLDVASPAYLSAPGGTSVYISSDSPVDGSSFFGVNFVADFESNGYFPLSDFDGVNVVLRNYSHEVFVTDIPRSAFAFVEIPIRPKLIAIGVHKDGGGGTQYTDFWDNAWASLAHAARMWPLNDLDWRWGPRRWITYTQTWFGVSSANLDVDESDDYYDIRDRADDILDPDFGELGMALIDGALYGDGPTGRAPLGPSFFGNTAVSYNFVVKDDTGKLQPLRSRTGGTIVQEASHMMGLVDEDASNHDSANESHSRFDEGEDTVTIGGNECPSVANLTFVNAVSGQLGANKRVVRLEFAQPPFEHPRGWCSSNRPRSSMAYAPGKNNGNTHLEPADFQAVRGYLGALRWWADFLGGVAGGGAELGGGGGGTMALRLRATIRITGEVRVTVCYLEPSAGPFSPEEPDGDWSLELRAADGGLLGAHRFAPSFYAHEAVSSERVALRVPFPAGTARVQIVHDAEVLWSKDVSPNPPAVRFLQPAGGTFSAEEFVAVSWTASDPDGDELQFALDYTPDGGATWHKLPQYLEETSYDWQPLYLPPANAAQLRVRASDGFNTATALSAPFTLEAAPPRAFIRKPENGAILLEGARVYLVGDSLTADGEPGSFLWEVDGEILPADTPSTSHVLELVGPHLIRLAAVDASGSSSETVEVTVQVIGDYDRDGMPNDFELEHGLNPLDFDDAGADEDGDGLSNRGEHELGTDPRDSDTDGDGWPDGEEYERDHDPADGADLPSALPVLLVGAESLAFTVREGEPAPEPTRFWITNGSDGDLFWSATASAPWVSFSPGGGEAPQEVALGVDPAGLGEGVYEAEVTVNAPGAAGSPQAIEVTLRVGPRREEPPPRPRFVRADVDQSGGINLTDGVQILLHLFRTAELPAPLRCLDAADADDSGGLNLTDGVSVFVFLFRGGSIPLPSPETTGAGTAAEAGDCGPDPTEDAVECETPPSYCG